MSSLIIIMAIFLYISTRSDDHPSTHVLCVCIIAIIHTQHRLVSDDDYRLRGCACVHRLPFDSYTCIEGFSFLDLFFYLVYYIIHSFRFNLSGDLCFLLYIQKLCAFFLRRRDESFHVSSHVCFFSSPIRNKNKNGRKKKNMFLRSSFYFVCYPCRI
jgi:hypothetical protein